MGHEAVIKLLEFSRKQESAPMLDMKIFGARNCSVACHSAILSLSLPSLRSILSEESCLIFPEFSLQELKTFLKFLYGGNSIEGSRETLSKISRVLTALGQANTSLVSPVQEHPQSALDPEPMETDQTSDEVPQPVGPMGDGMPQTRRAPAEIQPICPKCGDWRASEPDLATHLKTSHGLLMCDLPCGKTFKNKQNLANHQLKKSACLRFHSNDIQICHLCGRKFGSQHLLIDHQQRGRCPKKYQCLLCDSKPYFSKKFDLRNHNELIHSQIPPKPILILQVKKKVTSAS